MPTLVKSATLKIAERGKEAIVPTHSDIKGWIDYVKGANNRANLVEINSTDTRSISYVRKVCESVQFRNDTGVVLSADSVPAGTRVIKIAEFIAVSGTDSKGRKFTHRPTVKGNKKLGIKGETATHLKIQVCVKTTPATVKVRKPK